jgi:hypothetical protein
VFSKPDPEFGPERSYLDAVGERLADLLGQRLVGAYVGGSFALGDYRPPRSDLDVAAVIEPTLTDELREGIVEGLRHEALPCPARGLELVVYRLRTARSGSTTRDVELNLNSGARMPLRIETSPVESHWFPIDRSILAQAGVAITGPPAGEVFAAIDRAALIPVLVESIRW